MRPCDRGWKRPGCRGDWSRSRDHPTVVMDVAHNELSAQVLAEALRAQFGADRRRLILVVGLSRHHDPEPFLAPLAALRPALLIATAPAFRPRPASDVAAAARRLDMPNVQIVETGVTDAVRAALSQAGPDDLVCLTGSFYTVGDVPPALWSELLSEISNHAKGTSLMLPHQGVVALTVSSSRSSSRWAFWSVFCAAKRSIRRCNDGRALDLVERPPPSREGVEPERDRVPTATLTSSPAPLESPPAAPGRAPRRRRSCRRGPAAGRRGWPRRRTGAERRCPTLAVEDLTPGHLVLRQERRQRAPVLIQ